MLASRTHRQLPAPPSAVRRIWLSHGFTLIELLVVISIIALLVGILLPALGAARRTATILKCTTQIRQLGVGNASFETDHGHFVPTYEYGTPGVNSSNDIAHSWNMWKEALRDDGYVSAPEVFLCPIVADEGTETGNANDGKHVEPWSNYRINHVLAGPWRTYAPGSNGKWYHHPHSSGDVLKPSRTVMFAGHPTYGGFREGGTQAFQDWGHLDVAHLQSVGNGWVFSSPWGPYQPRTGSSSFAMVDGSVSPFQVTNDRYDRWDGMRLGNDEYFLTADGTKLELADVKPTN